MQKWTKKRALHFSDFSDEVKLLLLLSRYELKGSDLKQLQKIDAVHLNWNRFRELAIQSRLASVVYTNEKKWGLNLLPTELRAKFKQFKLKVISFNTQLYQDYETFQQRCIKWSIPCIPLKGVYLADQVYKDIGLRQISDIDLWVAKESQQAIMQILHELDWKVKLSVYKSKYHESLFEFHTAYDVLSEKNTFDFHHYLFDQGSATFMDYERLERNFEKTEVCGMETVQMEPHDHLIYLCLHTYKHLHPNDENNLRAFVDIAYFIETFGHRLNTKNVMARANLFGVSRQVKVILCLVQNLWITPNHPFFKNIRFTEFDDLTNKIVLRELMDEKFRFGELWRETFLKRIKLTHGWLTIPLLWYELFPSKSYLEHTGGKKGYWKNWRKRFFNLRNQI